MVLTRSTLSAPSSPPSVSVTSPSSEPSIEMTTTLIKNKDNIISTPAGVVTVRPYRSSSNAQLKAVLSFTPRVSPLDRTNVQSQTDQFRGFFVLFWIGLALLFIRTSLQSWDDNRTALSWNFGRLITRDAVMVALSDAIMSLSMFFCVLFVKALQYRYISYYWTGLVIQHVYQTAYLAVAVWWGYHRDWYWVQSGFLVLHALANLMKMHSYMAHNGMLATVCIRLAKEREDLDALVESVPGGSQALLVEAASREAELQEQEAKEELGMTPSGTPGLETPIGTPASSVSSSGGVTRAIDVVEGAQKILNGGNSTISRSTSRERTSDHLANPVDLRRRSIGNANRGRKNPTAASKLPEPQKGLPQGSSLELFQTVRDRNTEAPSPLAWSSNERVAVLARNIDAMQAELKSNGTQKLVWPENVTYRHFADFIFFPTLVYQLEYPRTLTMKPLVVLEKMAATFGTFSLIYLITEHYIMPYTPKPGESLIRSFVNLALPMMINYLLIFYIIFECVCTGFAELSFFADREFYQDWWNSTTWDQFSRKWNKPVHTFLLRHVYASTMDGLSLSRTSATFITFLLSAACHELVMAVVTKKIRPYLFLMQMAQLPMIAVGKIPAVKRSKTIGNIVFWIGLMAGFPLLCVSTIFVLLNAYFTFLRPPLKTDCFPIQSPSTSSKSSLRRSSADKT